MRPRYLVVCILLTERYRYGEQAFFATERPAPEVKSLRLSALVFARLRITVYHSVSLNLEMT